ncbi:MAG TPA: carbohydrate ABC transporter permease [Planctomycetota bacterium]|nr:carbohydrate ABC transporter permease [Planctomycetota bacterium]HRR80136.1 carbohydrate ABC transporter permease [Planctomycetota bacterium]HRT94969.1 carbohydrate ABC transporter permease [Planctomycetota bacterium]
MLTHAVLASGAGLVAFPFLWMLMTALKSEAEARGTPRLFPSGAPWQWHWGNFARAWHEMEPSFATCFFNTLMVSALVTVAVVVTSLLAGYAFARIRFVGRRALFVVFLATMMVPFEVVLVPNFMLVTAMKQALRDAMTGLLGQGALPAANTLGAFGALIVPWSANVFSIFLVTQFFRQMPQDYYDAAVLDGCGHWQFMWRIGAPMVMPALVTAGLFSFLGSWNSLLWPLVVNTPDEAPVLQVALSYMVREEKEGFNLLMAASTFTILPVVFLYLVAQRRFIEGVTGTGLKG